MAEYSNENRGSIWPNKKKETDKHPDFTGSLNVGGHDYWVSAWKRKPDASANAPSLTFQVKLKDGLREAQVRPAPIDLAASDRLFISSRMVPQGQVSEMEYIFFVRPQVYSNLPGARRYELARVIGRLNKNLERHRFIMIGPGRWGSSNVDLGVPVSYADIYNSSALVELAYSQKGITPEPSYGTHFFQDLVESQIYPLGTPISPAIC